MHAEIHLGGSCTMDVCDACMHVCVCAHLRRSFLNGTFETTTQIISILGQEKHSNDCKMDNYMRRWRMPWEFLVFWFAAILRCACISSVDWNIWNVKRSSTPSHKPISFVILDIFLRHVINESNLVVRKWWAKIQHFQSFVTVVNCAALIFTYTEMHNCAAMYTWALRLPIIKMIKLWNGTLLWRKRENQSFRPTKRPTKSGVILKKIFYHFDIRCALAALFLNVPVE